MSSALVGRQPILGSNGDIFAYELLFRSGAANSASVTDNASATANVLLNTLNSIGLDKLIGDKFAFINVDENFLASKVLDGLPKDKFVIEILETVKVDQNIIDRVSSLKNAGFTFAIDDIDLHPEQIKNFEPLFEFASVLKIDLLAAGGADKIKQKIDYFRGKNFKFLAEKVENASEYEKCKAMGFELFQGYFFEKPTIIEGKKIDSSEVSVIKILKKVQSGSDLGEIADEISRVPDLSINLLKYMNSSGAGTKCEISSIQQAVSFLGRIPLAQWLMLFLYAGANKNKFANPLMESALLRANIMSCFAQKLSKDKSVVDKAYLTGLLSLFDAIMQIPLDKIKEEIALDMDIIEAITTKKNALGKLVQIAAVVEKGDWDATEVICKKTGLKTEELANMMSGCYAAMGQGR